MYHWWGDGAWGWSMFAVMVIFWAAILALVVYAIRAFARRSATTTGPPAESALDILKKRYARGEIDREQFEQQKRDLT